MSHKQQQLSQYQNSQRVSSHSGSHPYNQTSQNTGNGSYSKIHGNNNNSNASHNLPPGSIAHKSSSQQPHGYSNTNQFEIILSKAMEVQEQMIGAAKNVQKVSKQTKTFKEIAESLISQMHYLQSALNSGANAHFQSLSSPTFKFNNQYKALKTSQQLDEEMEVATISTQMGNLFEEETNQLREHLREKEQVIEMLSKEKNYYIRRCEQQLKTIQQHSNIQSITSANQQLQDKISEMQADMAEKIKTFEESHQTIKSQNEVIERQAAYIKQFENAQAVMNAERESYHRRVEELDAEIQKLNQENHQLLQHVEKAQTTDKQGANDASRINQAQLKMFEQLVRENSQLSLQIKHYKEDAQMMNGNLEEMSRFNSQISQFDQNPKIVEIIQDIYFQIPSQAKPSGFGGSISIQDQLLDIKKFIDQKLMQGSSTHPLPLSPNKTSREGNTNIQVTQQVCQQLNNSQAKYDTKFCQLINVNLLDLIYQDFFKAAKSGSNQQEILEQKNRSFKDLFNMIEDSVMKFYDIFVKFKASELKNKKLEETFIQLDSVFNHDNQDSSEDSKVLEELRNLNQNTLSQFFKIQQELVELQALDGASSQILKLLRKSQDKAQYSNPNQKSQSNSQGDMFALEQQIIELNIKLQDYEKIIKQKERKQQRKLRQKSGGKSPGGLFSESKEAYGHVLGGDLDQSNISQMRRSHQVKSVDRSGLNVSSSYGFQNGLRFINNNNNNPNSNTTGINLSNHNMNQQQQSEMQSNLNKALDKLYEQEEKIEILEKEKSLLSLELIQLRNEFQQQISSSQVQEGKYLELSEKNLKLEDENQLMSRELKSMKETIMSLSSQIDECQIQLLDCEKEVQAQSDKAKRIADLNEELRDLIQQEREAYNDEKQKLEENIDSVNLSWESKLKLVKNKLLMALQNEGFINQMPVKGQREQSHSSILPQQNDLLSFEEVIKMACDAILQVRSSNKYQKEYQPPKTTIFPQAFSQEYTAGHSRQQSIGKKLSNQHRDQTSCTITEISPVKPLPQTSGDQFNQRYDQNIQNQNQQRNMIDQSLISQNETSNNNHHPYYSNALSGTNNTFFQKTPQKLSLQKVLIQTSSNKKQISTPTPNNNLQTEYMGRNNLAGGKNEIHQQRAVNQFDTFYDKNMNEQTSFIENDQNCLNNSFNAIKNGNDHNYEKSQQAFKNANEMLDLKLTQQTINNFMHNTINTQGPYQYRNLVNQKQLIKDNSKDYNCEGSFIPHLSSTQNTAPTIYHSSSLNHIHSSLISSPQSVMQKSINLVKTPNQQTQNLTNDQYYQGPTTPKINSQKQYQLDQSRQVLQSQQINPQQSFQKALKEQNFMHIQNDYEAPSSQTPSKSYQHEYIHNVQRQPTQGDSIRQIQRTTTDSDKPRRNINDILNSFKKEKESFNDKLHQLKSKLEAVKSPEPFSLKSNQYLGANLFVDQNEGNKGLRFYENTSDQISIPNQNFQAENRRAKTLQKLKGSENDEFQQINNDKQGGQYSQKHEENTLKNQNQ